MSEVARTPDTRTPIVRLADRYKLTLLIGFGLLVLAFIVSLNGSTAFGVFASSVAGLLFLVGGAGWMAASLLIAYRES